MPEGLPEGQEVPWRMKRLERTGPIPEPASCSVPTEARNGWREHYEALTDVPFVRHRGPEPALTDAPGTVVTYDSTTDPPHRAPRYRPRPTAPSYDPTPSIAANVAIGAAVTAGIIAINS